MMCGQRRQREDVAQETWPPFAGAARRGRPDVQEVRRQAPPRSPEERVSTAERERSAALVSRAYVDGLLGADELDERLGRVYGAVTVADLDAATEVLPAGWREEVAAEERDARRAQALGEWWRRGVATYLGVMALLVGIWLTVALTAGAWYPWPVWPALGWGVPLALGRPRRGAAGGAPRAIGVTGGGA